MVGWHLNLDISAFSSTRNWDFLVLAWICFFLIYLILFYLDLDLVEVETLQRFSTVLSCFGSQPFSSFLSSVIVHLSSPKMTAVVKVYNHLLMTHKTHSLPCTCIVLSSTCTVQTYYYEAYVYYTITTACTLQNAYLLIYRHVHAARFSTF